MPKASEPKRYDTKIASDEQINKIPLWRALLRGHAKLIKAVLTTGVLAALIGVISNIGQICDSKTVGWHFQNVCDWLAKPQDGAIKKVSDDVAPKQKKDGEPVAHDRQYFSRLTPIYISVQSNYGQDGTEGFYKSISSKIDSAKFNVTTKSSASVVNLTVDVINNGAPAEDIDAESGKKISVYKSCPSIEISAKWDYDEHILIKKNPISACRSVGLINDGYNDAAAIAVNAAVVAMADEIVSQLNRAITK